MAENLQINKTLNKVKDRVKVYSSVSIIPIETSVEYIRLVSFLLKHHGKKGALIKLKDFRAYLQTLAIGLECKPLPFCATGANNHPKVRNNFCLAILTRDPDIVKAVLTLFNDIENWSLPPVLDKTTITDPLRDGCVVEIPGFGEWCSQWNGPSKRIEIKREDDLHRSSKAGPNGLATRAAVEDMAVLSLEENIPTLQNMAMVLQQTNGQPVIDLIIEIITGRQGVSPKSSTKAVSKVCVISDKAGKSRAIAIGDYWTQRALSPIHKYLMEIRKHMETDCTFAQTHARSYIMKNLNGSKWLGSVDITAATDRFPRQSTVAVLNPMIGELSRLWEQLISNRPFRTDDGDIYYSVGQPIGFYSSWPAFALTMHALVEYSASTVGFKYFRDYRVLGDDVLIGDKSVYDAFIRNLGSLGVSTNPNKSTQGRYSVEFAKRRYIRHRETVIEITGLPVGRCRAMLTEPSGAIDLINIIVERGYDPMDTVSRVAYWTKDKHPHGWASAAPLVSYLLHQKREGESPDPIWQSSFDGMPYYTAVVKCNLSDYVWPLGSGENLDSLIRDYALRNFLRKINRNVDTSGVNALRTLTSAKQDSSRSGLTLLPEKHPRIFARGSYLNDSIIKVWNLEALEEIFELRAKLTPIKASNYTLKSNSRKIRAKASAELLRKRKAGNPDPEVLDFLQGLTETEREAHKELVISQTFDYCFGSAVTGEVSENLVHG